MKWSQQKGEQDFIPFGHQRPWGLPATHICCINPTAAFPKWKARTFAENIGVVFHKMRCSYGTSGVWYEIFPVHCGEGSKHQNRHQLMVNMLMVFSPTGISEAPQTGHNLGQHGIDKIVISLFQSIWNHTFKDVPTKSEWRFRLGCPVASKWNKVTWSLELWVWFFMVFPRSLEQQQFLKCSNGKKGILEF